MNWYDILTLVNIGTLTAWLWILNKRYDDFVRDVAAFMAAIDKELDEIK